MTPQEQNFALTARAPGDPAPTLVGVQAQGRLDGVLFELTLRQTYRNTSARLLEVVYTFPLPLQAVLLGFASELNGERKTGTIVARRQAERDYEAALEAGDAPVMLEALEGGLHSADIGNLKPGDELVLELRYAQLLAFEQGRVRVAIPTTIAPRFGSAVRAGLQPQQVPQASLTVEYPLALSVTVAPALKGATVECPTHAWQRTETGAGLRLDLDRGAWLDRDVVLVLQPREPRPSLLVRAADSVSASAPVVCMAAWQVPQPARRARIAVRVLVDCSGSMAGDSIASARLALRGALAALTEDDEVSLSRFGSQIEHLVMPTAATRHTLRHLGRLVDEMQADLGGTEMEGALSEVMALPGGAVWGRDVLLLTDGEIWQADGALQAARASGSRVFAIGLGTSAAEAVLRGLAEASGGACEFATPGEALEAAARRMLDRMRQQAWQAVRVDWGTSTEWCSPSRGLHGAAFGGDTLVSFAGLPPGSPTVRPRLVAWQEGEIELCPRPEADAPGTGDTWARIAAARRMAGSDAAQALSLAVAYQLMSPLTNCVLVHQRAAADQVQGAAELQRVESMLAAGWGGTAAAAARAEMLGDVFGASAGADDFICGSMDAREIGLACYSEKPASAPRTPAVMRRAGGYGGLLLSASDDHDDDAPATLLDIAWSVSRALARSGPASRVLAVCYGLHLHAAVQPAIDAVIDLGFADIEAWLLLAHWVNGREDGFVSTVLAEQLEPRLAALDATRVAQALQVLTDRLGSHGLEEWDQPPLRA